MRWRAGWTANAPPATAFGPHDPGLSGGFAGIPVAVSGHHGARPRPPATLAAGQPIPPTCAPLRDRARRGLSARSLARRLSATRSSSAGCRTATAFDKCPGAGLIPGQIHPFAAPTLAPNRRRTRWTLPASPTRGMDRRPRRRRRADAALRAAGRARFRGVGAGRRHDWLLREALDRLRQRGGCERQVPVLPVRARRHRRLSATVPPTLWNATAMLRRRAAAKTGQTAVAGAMRVWWRGLGRRRFMPPRALRRSFAPRCWRRGPAHHSGTAGAMPSRNHDTGLYRRRCVCWPSIAPPIPTPDRHALIVQGPSCMKPLPRTARQIIGRMFRALSLILSD